MAKKDVNHLPLRERVAARKRGDTATTKMTREERDKRDKLYLFATTLQVVGLIALIGYAWWAWEQGFETINLWLVIAPSAMFLIGRAILISLNIARKRR